jgi:lipopolysaccharide biosynthesis regulator YciM
LWFRRLFGRRAPPFLDADRALRDALLAVLAGDLAAAERALVRASQSPEASVDAHLAIGRVFRQRGEIGRAIRVHQNLLLRNDLTRDQHTAALADLAENYREGGFHPRAIASYEELLAREPDHPKGLASLPELLAGAREYRRALALLRRRERRAGRRSGPAEALLLVRIAREAHAAGKSGTARRSLWRALRRDPSCAAAWRLRAEWLSERGRERAAIAAWKRALALAPEQAGEMHAALIAATARAKREREHQLWLEQELSLRPDDVAARCALARVLAERGDIDRAIAELGRISAPMAGLEVQALRGRLLLRGAREQEALAAFAALLDTLERAEAGEGIA